MSPTASLTVFDTGDEIRLRASEHGMRFLLVSGAPIREPVAWHGPVVMNTREEISRRSRSCGPERSWTSDSRRSGRPLLLNRCNHPDDVGKRGGHVVDEGVDVRLVRAEAEHAHPTHVTPSRDRTGDHHATAGRSCAPSGRVSPCPRPAAWRRATRRGTRRATARARASITMPGSDATRRAASSASARFSTMARAEGVGAEQLHREPHAQTREPARQVRPVLARIVEVGSDAASLAGSPPSPRAPPAAPSRRARGALRCRTAGTCPCADRA